MSKVQSKELTAFYRAYKQWLDDGVKTNNCFYEKFGIVSNLLSYNIVNKIDLRVGLEFKIQLINSGLDELNPFGLHLPQYPETNPDSLEQLIKWIEDHLKPEFTGENNV